MFAEWFNPMAQGWARWVVISTVDATVVLAAVTAVWLLCRRKLSAQFGYLLFLLVFLKLLLPLEIAVPRHWAVCSPGYHAGRWLGMSQRSPGAIVPGEERTKTHHDLVAGNRDKVAGPAESPVGQAGSTPAIPAGSAGLDRSILEGRSLPDEQESAAVVRSIEAAPTVSGESEPGPAISLAAWAMLAWASAVLALLGVFTVMQWRLSREMRGARPIDPGHLPLLSEALREKIGLRRTVPIVQSERTASPVVWGVFRPVVILPTELCDGLSSKQLEWVVLHELAHVRRGDVAAACFQQLMTTVYCFNPAVWIAGRMLHRLREYACDDIALAAGSATRRQSGEAFLHVAERASAHCNPLAMALGVCNTKNTLRRRLMRLLDTRRPLRTRLGLGAFAVLLVLSVILLPSFRASGISAVGAASESTLASEETTTVAAKDATDESKDADDGETVKQPDASLLLTVLDDNDNPVPAANVTLRIRQVAGGPWKVTRHQCDASGRLRVDVPRETPAYCALKVELPGYAPFFADWEQRDGPDPIPESYTARLDPGRLIGGIVQNEDGEPIQGAKVSPWFNLKMREERSGPLGAGVDVTTDVQGRWTYPSFPTDIRQTTIAMTHPDYAATRVSEPVAKFALSPDETPTSVLVIRRGLTIAGTVTDEEGRPVQGAVVRSHDKYESSPPKTETDESGSYRFTNGRAGESFFTASAEGWAPSLREVEIAPGMDPVVFKLTRGKPLRLRVVDSDGNALPGVGVSLSTWRKSDIMGTLPSSRGQTGADGVWQWPHAPEGPIEFGIFKTGYARIGRLELKAGEQENVVTMHPEETQLLRVSGRVIDGKSKEPVERFHVIPGVRHEGLGMTSWRQASRSRGRGGTYRREFSSSEFSSPVAHVIRIEADGYLPATSRRLKMDEGDVTIDFELQKAPASGVVVLTPQGEIANQATVAVCTPRLGPIIENGVVLPNSSCEQTTTDAEGRFIIAPQNGPFALTVLHESGAAYVTDEEYGRSKTIQLEPWARVEGTLLIGNKPAADQFVTLDRGELPRADTPRLHYSYRTTTDKNGRFTFESIVPGDVQITRCVVSEHGQSSRWTPTHLTKARLAAGETTEVELRRDGRPVVGKLLMPSDDEQAPDWRFAIVYLTGPRPHSPPPPQIPWPKEIDREKDREAALKWWEAWMESEAAKRFQEERRLYAEAARGRQPVSYGTKVEPDGSLRFDDVPAGDYTLTVQLEAPPAPGRIVPGGVIANLRHAFTVPEMPGGRSDEPLDLGSLTLSPSGN
ncbi:MAG: carboxypeptidase regulatory-like domain-containing protein [Planctomycetota bacterium]